MKSREECAIAGRELARMMEADASAAAPGESELETLGALADRAEELRTSIDVLQDQLAGLQGELQSIEADRIPSLMDAVGVSSFKTRSGLGIEVIDAVSTMLGRGRDEAEADHRGRVKRAYGWLREQGHDGIIKRTLTVALGKGSDAVADRVAGVLKAQGVDFTDREEVHPQALGAFVREQLGTLAAGAFPRDLFRVSLARIAKIKRDQPRKSRR